MGRSVGVASSLDAVVAVGGTDVSVGLWPTTAVGVDVAFSLHPVVTTSVSKMNSVKAFKVPDKPVDMLRSDLEDAKIPYVDDAGRYADFHALRHTTGSFLVASGVHPKVVQSIMRHSDINLTMGRYTHVFRGQESKAVAKLPDLSQPSKEKQRAIATGTDGKNLPENLPFLGVQQRILANSNEQQNRVSGIENVVFERARQDSNLQPSDSKSATLSN